MGILVKQIKTDSRKGESNKSDLGLIQAGSGSLVVTIRGPDPHHCCSALKWSHLEFLCLYSCGWSWPAALMMMELSLLIIIRVVILPQFRAQPLGSKQSQELNL